MFAAVSVSGVQPLPTDRGGVPLGTAWLNGGVGVDVRPAGYREDEYLVSGTAGVWAYDPHGVACRLHTLPYVTRMLVRRPQDAGRFSGVVQMEPLHQEYDSAMTWRATHAWIMRTGSAWVGVTHHAPIAASLRDEFDPQRYGELSIPETGMGFDIVGGIAHAIRVGAVPGLAGAFAPARIFLSGWSATASFCRAFLGDGFHDRHRNENGSPAFDGYLLGVSSGGAPRGGYPPLSDGVRRPEVGDERRTIGGHDVPVIELLSELESETHEPCLRPDSDAPSDRYRLYQVAGTSHDSFGPRRVLTNAAQYRRRGLDVPPRRINEAPSDARGEVVAHAVFALLDRWAHTGEPPPSAPRFELADQPPDHHNPSGPARALHRDRFGNAIGGIRAPWVEVPVAAYHPTSTPAPGLCRPSRWAPTSDPAHIAALIGSMTPLARDDLRELYHTREEYLKRYEQACRSLLADGFLLDEDVGPLLGHAAARPLAIG